MVIKNRYRLQRKAQTGSDESQKVSSKGSIVAHFSRHKTAAHLLTAMIVLIGLLSLKKLNRQFFPDLQVPVVTVSINWPGASAVDITKNILSVFEPKLRFIDSVEKVRSYAKEGVASISMEFEAHSDMQKAQSDIEQAIASITNLPDSAEPPKIKRATIFEHVARISVTGPFTERVLKSYAKTIRDGLLASGIDKVDMRGTRNEEIHINISEADLRRLNINLEEIASRIDNNTKDLPAGTLKGDNERQLLSKADREIPEEISGIEIKPLATGHKVYLKDISSINTAFERDGMIGWFNDIQTISQNCKQISSGSVCGIQAIELEVKRSLTADTLKTMKVMEEYIIQAKQQLPKSLRIHVYDVTGKYVEDRLYILLKNGLQGLVLVLIALFIFLNFRVALWTAAGIPVAIFATLGVMWVTGQSLNMVSMFALIMMLGIIVDDAIVVGEHTASLEEGGIPRTVAAELGAVRMFTPVSAAILTTAAAFLPIFFITGAIGEIMSAIPLVVIAALLASMLECFFILPGHLRHGQLQTFSKSTFRHSIDSRFEWFRDTIFLPLVHVSFRWRYSTIAFMGAGLILAFGALAGERVRFVFFPQIESENALASIYFAPGVPRVDQIKAVDKVQRALFEAEQFLLSNTNKVHNFTPHETQNRLVKMSFAILGRIGRQSGNNLAEINAQLTSSEARAIRTRSILSAWRAALPEIPGVERIVVYGRRSGPPGRDVDVQLYDAPINVLKDAAQDLKVHLTSFKGVSSIEDDLPYGAQELVFKLTPRGKALGFTSMEVGQQVRNAFEGVIATRFTRGDEEIKVRLYRKQDIPSSAVFYNMHLRTPAGVLVPLRDVVSLNERQTFSTIQRKDGITTVNVTADINQKITTTSNLIDRLELTTMPSLAEKYNIKYSYGGREEERGNAFKDLKIGALLSLVMIYVILGLVFESFFKPLVVMSIIPFGFVGAVYGHYVMGYDLTLPSLIGLLGLSGILINDSIVMVTRLVERQKILAEDLEKAVVGAASDRLRAVLLTSLTTIGGLVPLLFETSLQAQFLIPLAITIVFGLTMATFIVLIIVPCFIGIARDIEFLARRVFKYYISNTYKAI